MGISERGRWLVVLLTTLEAHLVELESSRDALLSGVHGLAALRALGVFNGLERHGDRLSTFVRPETEKPQH